MSTPSQPTPPPAGDDRQAVNTGASPIEPPFDERLRVFWEKYRGAIVGVCVFVLVLIVGRAGWDLIQQRRAAALSAEYGRAEDPAQLKAFAAEHAGETLAGVAQLRLGDEAYAAGRFAEAASSYDAAAETLEDSVLAARARLGAAMSRLKSGQEEAGRNALESIANDVSVPKALRAEAVYHLASAAAGAGRSDEVNRLIEQINSIDSTSLWAQRAATLRQAQPADDSAPAESTEGEAPTITFPGQTP